MGTDSDQTCPNLMMSFFTCNIFIMLFETLEEDILCCIFVISMEYSLFALQYAQEYWVLYISFVFHHYRHFVVAARCCFFWLCSLGCNDLPQRERRLEQALDSLHIDLESESHLKQ